VILLKRRAFHSVLFYGFILLNGYLFSFESGNPPQAVQYKIKTKKVTHLFKKRIEDVWHAVFMTLEMMGAEMNIIRDDMGNIVLERPIEIKRCNLPRDFDLSSAAETPGALKSLVSGAVNKGTPKKMNSRFTGTLTLKPNRQKETEMTIQLYFIQGERLFPQPYGSKGKLEKDLIEAIGWMLESRAMTFTVSTKECMNVSGAALDSITAELDTAITMTHILLPQENIIITVVSFDSAVYSDRFGHSNWYKKQLKKFIDIPSKWFADWEYATGRYLTSFEAIPGGNRTQVKTSGLFYCSWSRGVDTVKQKYHFYPSNGILEEEFFNKIRALLRKQS
jgi:hypothetical protein